MPRLAGQIDRVKAEATLAAASQVISERGFGAPLETIAKRAGVSKQTLYNHYGGKSGLVRAVIRRRVDRMTAPLTDAYDTPQTEAVLATFAESLMTAILSPATVAATRIAIQGAVDMPDIALAMQETGAVAANARLATFLRTETAAGRLSIDDADEAAELFVGMVGARQVAALLGRDVNADRGTIEQRSAKIARLFMNAFEPKRGRV
jgi:TetR/AcrR family transcriptional repressor of mexJK operon